ncbi:DNA polymerase III subunit gamma/tau [Mycetocola sp. 2940]|uniref:DNA polymerase III subunit gamma/tau n=1 Tax=Mycetocola sp. 2940 TaxID=3156452 RepID=UPI00339284F1
MSSDHPDDDALTWAGDAEPAAPPTRGTTPTDAATPRVAGGWKVVGKPGRVATPDADRRQGQMSSVALVAFGILAGIYLLYTIGWLIAAQRATNAPTDIVGAAMYTVGLWFAVLAPALWIGATFWLTRASGSLRARFLALVAGAIVLIPWPFIVGGN